MALAEALGRFPKPVHGILERRPCGIVMGADGRSPGPGDSSGSWPEQVPNEDRLQHGQLGPASEQSSRGAMGRCRGGGGGEQDQRLVLGPRGAWCTTKERGAHSRKETARGQASGSQWQPGGLTRGGYNVPGRGDYLRLLVVGLVVHPRLYCALPSRSPADGELDQGLAAAAVEQ